MKTFAFKKFALLLSAGLLCLCAHSQTFQVTTTADSGPGSLRDAMTNAIAIGGGTIIFPNFSGTINLQSALPDISGNLTILGNGPANTVINTYRTNRVFNVLTGAICNISDLTVQGSGPTLPGYPYSQPASTAIMNAGTMSISNCFLHDHGSGDVGGYGGGTISSGAGGLVLNNVVVSNNVASFASALSASNVRATNCLFINNSEKDGAPIGTGGDSVFSGTTFTGNSARLTGNGGGIWAAGNLTLLNCNVVSNYGDFSAGGIYFNGNNLTISNCAINNNTSSRKGGIYATGTNIVILNSSISGNSAVDYGGIYMGPNGYLDGCTISSNSAMSGYPAGIALFGYPGTVRMTNCTISGNWTTFTPGAGVLCQYQSVVQAVNCTIAFNGYGVQNIDNSTFYALNTIIANNGTGPTNGDFSGTLTSQGYNLIGRLSTNTIIVGSTNKDIYGVDPLLGPLRNNGGPTLTHALTRGSLAINAGTNIGAPLTDQRGVARPCGKEVDIGAFEYDALLFTDISRVNSTNIHLRVEGPPASTCTIQASSNFLDWENVFASSNGLKGVWEYVDQDAGNHPNRFYRAVIDN